MKILALVPLFAVALFCGCADQQMGENPGGNTPPMANNQVPEVSADNLEVLKKNQETLKGAYEDAKKAYKENPKDAKLKEACLDATLAMANFNMSDSPDATDVKYPNALRQFREVLVLQPGNKTATESIQLMEAIYKSLGKPVPE